MKIHLKEYSKGDIMRFIREWTNLTQKDFARRIGKSTRTVQNYEAGKVNYGIDILKKIEKEFDLDITIEKNKSL